MNTSPIPTTVVKECEPKLPHYLYFTGYLSPQQVSYYSDYICQLGVIESQGQGFSIYIGDVLTEFNQKGVIHYFTHEIFKDINIQSVQGVFVPELSISEVIVPIPRYVLTQQFVSITLNEPADSPYTSLFAHQCGLTLTNYPDIEDEASIYGNLEIIDVRPKVAQAYACRSIVDGIFNPKPYKTIVKQLYALNKHRISEDGNYEALLNDIYDYLTLSVNNTFPEQIRVEDELLYNLINSHLYYCVTSNLQYKVRKQKKIVTNSTRLFKSERIKEANQRNGTMKIERSMAKIQLGINRLKAANKKVNKNSVFKFLKGRRAEVGLSTIDKYWELL